MDKKTLKRWPDAVVMSGSLASELIGKPIANLRVYACKNGAFEPIRYQVDEMTEDGDWIFDSGPTPNTDLGNGRFDTFDKVVFMARDAGNRVAKEAWTPGYTKGVEIEIIDPVTGEKGWCYLLYFASNPPARSSLPDSVRFNLETNEMVSEFFHFKSPIAENGEKSGYLVGVSIPESAGGCGKNFVDKLKIRPTLKLFFSVITLRLNENLMGCDILAYKQGPVRVIKRFAQYGKVPAGKMLFRAVADVYAYDIGQTIPITFHFPFNLAKITSNVHVQYGTDYNENAFGSKLCNSENLRGFLVDGKMDENERNMNPAPPSWRMLTGPCGTFIAHMVVSPDFSKYVKVSAGIVDDITHELPPENFPGSIGYFYGDYEGFNAPRGTYWVCTALFYVLPNYKPGDEMHYANYFHHPVKIKVGNQEEIDQIQLVVKSGKLY